MKAPLAVAFAIVTFSGSASFAQESVVGTYNGNYEVQTQIGMQRFGVTLVINSVEDGKVKGVGRLQRGGCQGEYPVEGTLKGNELAVRATQKGGPAGDCSFGFRGNVEGNRLVGKMGKYDVEFRK